VGAIVEATLIGAKLSDGRAAFPLPACGEREQKLHIPLT